MVVPNPAAEVKNQPVLSDRLDHFRKAVLVEGTLTKNVRSDNDVGCSSVEKGFGIARVNAASKLKSAREGAEGGEGGWFVSRSEHDDMAALELVLPVKLGEVFGRVGRDEVRFEPGFMIRQRAADDLFHFALVQVDAGSEHGWSPPSRSRALGGGRGEG